MSERRLTALRYHARLVYTLRGFTASDARAYARCEIQTKHEVHTIHKSAIHSSEGADYGRCSGRLMQKLQIVQRLIEGQPEHRCRTQRGCGGVQCFTPLLESWVIYSDSPTIHRASRNYHRHFGVDVAAVCSDLPRLSRDDTDASRVCSDPTIQKTD